MTFTPTTDQSGDDTISRIPTPGQPPLQPLLANELVVFAAPTQVWSGHDGELGDAAIHGIYHSDMRLFSALRLSVGGEAPEPISHWRDGAGTVTFVALLRSLDDRGADPRVRLDRVRTITDGLVTETFTLSSAVAHSIDTDLTLVLRPDFSQMHAVKAGLATHSAEVGAPGPGVGETATLTVTPTPVGADYACSATHAELIAEGGAVGAAPDGDTWIRWRIHLDPHGATTVGYRIALDDSVAVVSGAPSAASGERPSIQSSDPRLARWLDTALDDLDALRLVTRDHPDQPFLAAGAPWFFTLFGRDSLWAARFLLPFGTELAASTLSVLARLQGTHDDAETAEQPGKIMHELRASELLIPGENVSLPPLYYGTVDATALWVILLHDAWMWGLDDDSVRALLPNLRRALQWMRDHGDSDGDGFLEYADSTGHGLANQGWKDSGDSIQWRDGRLADGPIALCEVQGYAYEAAVGGAELLAHFGDEPAADEWRAWAAALKARFAERFWIDAPDGAYPAVALDASKRRVDTITSNIGHLLGTGILQPGQAELIARRLVSPGLSSGYGLRTMSTDSAGYWPLSYHGGSVWAHDTAIAIAGLGREGLTAEAAELIEGLLAAAEGFGYRMPELHSGDPRSTSSRPVPYPAACRPQAWSAAAAVSVLQTALGLAPDARRGVLGVSPIRPAVSGALRVSGIRFAGAALTFAVSAEGELLEGSH